MSFQCSRYWGRLLNTKRLTDRLVRFRCKRWKCLDCCIVNARVLRDELTAILNGYLEKADLTEAKLRYSAKLVTLTLPGAYWRSIHTVEDSEKIIKRNLGRFLDLLRKSRGVRVYFWVKEYQSSGYPHIHLIVLGEGVADRDFLDFCVNAWEKVCDMGNIDVAAVKDVAGMARYLTKYLTKGLESGLAYSRVFSMSSEAKKVGARRRWDRKQDYTVVELGRVGENGRLCPPFFVLKGLTEWELTKDLLQSHVLSGSSVPFGVWWKCEETGISAA